MRILFIADGRSPTALSWLRYWPEAGHEVHLISTFPCERPAGLASFHVLPVGFARLAGSQVNNVAGTVRKPALAGSLRDFLLPLRYYLGPISLLAYRPHFKGVLAQTRPEIVHALRIPFEGMLASRLSDELPLVLSTWGNDLTLHAHGSFLMAGLTRRALKRADGLITDTQRDIRLGRDWGYSPEKPTLVVPGSGGIRPPNLAGLGGLEALPEALPDAPIVVNARGQRPGSLRQDVFFQAIPLVLQEIPQAVFVCPSLAGDPEAKHWVETLAIGANTKLWPRLNQAQLWSLFQNSQVYVSPSVHDGTPNSLLETMSVGCFPVVGDIESMREWVQTGVNGMLVDARDARALADGILQAIKQPALRAGAAQYNARLIAERAAYEPNMKKVELFYERVLNLRLA